MPTSAGMIQTRKLFGSIVIFGIFFLLFGFGSTPGSSHLVPTPCDKAIHFGVFAILAIGLRTTLPTLPVNLIALLAIGIGLVDELHQYLVPGRQPGIDDWLADCAGTLGGLLIWPWLERRLFSCQCPT